ncbi:MAG: SusC/RagA family TonB-linked outer membrane protein [Paludibacter sp.]|nr:SusC/RagA family TonB-linked outer membrane protein [Paludibacter sp.]
MKSVKLNEITLNESNMSNFRIVRTLFVLLTYLLFQTTNSKAFSQTATITLDMKNVTVESVLNEIETKTSYRFLFNKQLVDVNQNISITVINKEIGVVLKTLFDKTDIAFTVNGRQIVLSKKINQIIKGLTGLVTDQKGEAIIGATVVIKGTRTGTVTNFSGNFNFETVPEKVILEVSYIGYKPVEILVGAKNNVIIKLEEDIKTLGEVIVTALGIKREEKALGYAVQVVSGSGLQTVKGVDTGTSLTGKVAGLLVKNSTEFAEAPSIQIRGEYPILVIDGVPYANMTLRDIPSDDIENISVLKGATASALYGARGGGGAIMVTTKKGSSTNGLTVTINSGSMFNAGFLAIPELQATFGRVVTFDAATNAYTYVRSGDGSWGVPMDGREIIQWDPFSKSMKPMPYLPIGKDNFKNFLEQGYILNNNINVVQQTEFGSFRSSATWVKNKGQYPNSMFDKITYSMGGEMKLGKFNLSSSMAYNKHTSPNVGFNGYTGYDPMYNLLVWSSADYNILDYKDYWIIKNELQNSSYTDTNNNPYFDRFERIHSINKDIFNGTLAVNYQILSGLKATFRSGFDTYSDKQEVRLAKSSLKSAGDATVITNGSQIWGEGALGQYNTGLGRGYSFNNDFLLTGEKKFGDFSIDGFVGGSIFYRQDEGQEAFTQGGLSIPGYYSLKASINPSLVKSRLSRRQDNSLYGRMAFAWKSLLFAEATLRNDWTSTLPVSTRSYLYPSFSGSFVASELLPKVNWLSLWKIRGSWTNFKSPPGIYSVNSAFNITNSAWGSLSAAALPTTIRGADVRPQSASTFEVGTAINLLKNRASLDVSYYSKRDYDALRSAGVSAATGYFSNFINIAEEITRKGVEISANGTPIKSRDWQWDVAVNWTTYARYYTKLDPLFSADKSWVKVGNRFDVFTLRDYQKEPATNKLIINNGLPQYSQYESVHGYSDPDWIWGANSTLRFKNWAMSVSLDGRVGGIAATTTEMYMWRTGSHPKSVTTERMLDATVGGNNYIAEGVKVVSGTATYDTYGNILTDNRVFVSNDIATTYQNYINAIHKGTAWGGVPSPLDAYSTTFLKIREVSLSYIFPKRFCEFVKATNISLSAIGQNVFLWAKQFKYSDPDGGYENFSDPSQRYLGFNIKVGF